MHHFLDLLILYALDLRIHRHAPDVLHYVADNENIFLTGKVARNVALVLCDTQMEHGDGFFHLVEIQKMGHRVPPAPLLFFISAHTEISEQHATDQGAKALLRRRLNVDELLA